MEHREGRLWAAIAAVVMSAATAQAAVCWGDYYLDNARKIHTGWVDAGHVFMTSAHVGLTVKCGRFVAPQNVAKATALLKSTYAPVGSANFKGVCNRGGTDVFWMAKVDSLRCGSGTNFLKVTCLKTPDGKSWFKYQ